MLNFLKILFLLLLCKGVAIGQQLLPANSNDCRHAIVLTDTIYGETNAPIGYGEAIEINGNNIYTDNLFEKEHNTTWYKFIVPANAVELSFDIVPISIQDDYDFILYKENESLCEQIQSKKAIPLRSCISRNDRSLKSCTGLSSKGKKLNVGGGIGDSYCKPLAVTEGEKYLLVLDNVYPNGKGHTLKIHYVYKKKSFPLNAAPIIINITDATSKKLLVANVEITQAKNEEFDTMPLFKMEGKSNYTLPFEIAANYKITCFKEGYTVQSERVSAVKAKDTLMIEFKLTKLEAGAKVTFDKIYFVGNTAEFLPISMPALKDLLNTMQKNSSVSIEIHGHVNGPKSIQEPPEYLMDLSVRRAKAVYNYLAENGIAANRLSYKGFGNTQMLYPDPINELESAANRRVEIFITK